ncbi:12899_t:CDS:2 [Rhizophagus irregularis]|nr:12899_t:CDS:2 [Rhizophagus irregularis]
MPSTPSQSRRRILRRLVKSRQTNMNTDNLVRIYNHCKLFLQTLAQEANNEAETDNTNVVEEKHVKVALEKVLHEFQG